MTASLPSGIGTDSSGMTVSMAQIIHQMCQKCLGTIKGGVFQNEGVGYGLGKIIFVGGDFEKFLTLKNIGFV
jgi:hypothetical protein